MIGQLFAAVPGQREAELFRQMLDLCRQRSHDSLRFFAADFGEHDIAGAPLDQRGDKAVLKAGDQVTFPVTENGAVLDSGRPLPDRDRILDLPKAVAFQACVARPPDKADFGTKRSECLLSALSA